LRPIIQSKKHYVQLTLTTITTGAINHMQIIVATAPTLNNLANEIEEGAIVKAVYLEMWGIGSVTNQFFTAVVVKLPGGQNPPAAADFAALNAYDNKKNILFTTQGLASNDGIAGPYPLFKGWIKIPKGKQRFGLGDQLRWSIMSRGSDDIIVCGFATYKEYT